MTQAGIISTVKAPVEQLEMFINYHLNIGVKLIVLFFDDPDDSAIEHFSDNPKVISILCDQKYWNALPDARPDAIPGRQIVNVNIGADILKEHAINWLIHIDSDELIRPLKPLAEVLDNSNSDIVVFQILEAFPLQIRSKGFYSQCFFKQKPTIDKIHRAKRYGCRNAIYKNKYLKGHFLSKCAVRISPAIKKYRIHSHIGVEPITPQHTTDVQLLHYDCIDIVDWKGKWDSRLRHSNHAMGLGKNRQSQREEYENAKQTSDKALSKLYKRMHMLHKREIVQLFLLRMLTFIRIDKTLFYRSPNQ